MALNDMDKQDFIGKKENQGGLEPDISVVVPVFNEQEVIEQMSKRLCQVLGSAGMSYEVIFIDDGSHDQSLEILKKICQNNHQLKIVSFSRNFGHQVAVSAGLDTATGRAVVVIDADLQDPPEVILEFVKKWQEGYQVVYAVRRKRKENIFKKAAYAVYYRVLHRLADINIPLDAGDFCLMDQKVARLISDLPERTRFIRGLRSWAGFKQIGIEYDRDRRMAGDSKYTFSKLVTLALDGIISFSGTSLRLAAVAGFVISTLSLIFGVYVIINRLFIDSGQQIPGWTSILVAVIFFGGIQLIIIGLVGEYTMRIFNEVKRRPLYVVREKVGFNGDDASKKHLADI